MRSLFTEISGENGQFGASNVSSLPKKEESLQQRRSLDICGVRKIQVGKGLPHDCKVTKAPENIVKLVETLPEKQKEQLIHSMIKE